MVGFALIGLATSLPELSTIVTALRIRRYEMAFGQVFGTNFVNLSLILLADAVFAGGPVINELYRVQFENRGPGVLGRDYGFQTGRGLIPCQKGNRAGADGEPGKIGAGPPLPRPV
jgi:hypothetical protein